MNKAIIIIALISVVILAGIIWLEQPSIQKKTKSLVESSQEALETKEASFNFGTISMAEGEVKHAFQIKNTGPEPVVIERIYTSCMCTTASLEIGAKKFGPFGMAHGFVPSINKKLDPGEEAQVEVIFDPGVHGAAGVGYIERVVYLETSAGLEELQISATVTP